MPIPDDSIIQVTFRGLYAGQKILMVRHYTNFGVFPAGTVQANLQEVIDDVAAAGTLDIETAYRATLPPEYQLTEIRAQQILATRSAYTSQFPGAAVGTWATSALTGNRSSVITLRTPEAGRNQVANMKIGPAPDDSSVDGSLTVAYKAALAALGSKLVTTFTMANGVVVLAPVIFHRATNTKTVTGNFILNPFARVERRRTVGLGE